MHATFREGSIPCLGHQAWPDSAAWAAQAHNLKNGESLINKAVSGLSCKLRLLLTGTPVQNNLGEFYAMFDTACPGLLGTPAEFRRTFQNSILAGRDAGASDKDIQRVGAGAQAAAPCSWCASRAGGRPFNLW